MSIARRSLQVVALVCTLIVGAASMAVIVTQTTWFKEWLRGFIVKQAEDYVNGRLSIGRLDGNLFFGVELEDVDVTMNGETVVDIKDVGLDYNVFSFLSGDVVLDDIRLNQPVFRVEKDADGWNLAQADQGAHAGSRRAEDAPPDRDRRDRHQRRHALHRGRAPSARPASTCRRESSGSTRRSASTSNEDELTVEIAHVSLRAADAVDRRQRAVGRDPPHAKTVSSSRTSRCAPRRPRCASTGRSATSKSGAPDRSISRPRPTSSTSRRSRGSFRRCAATRCSRRSRSAPAVRSIACRSISTRARRISAR